MTEITSETLEAVDKTLDAAEEVAEAVVADVVEVVEVVRNNPVVLVGVGLAGLAAGGAVGYFVTKKVLVTKYDRILEEQIENAREHYKRKSKAEELSTIESAAESLLPEDVREALKTYDGRALTLPGDEEPVVYRTRQEEPEVRDIMVNNAPIDEDDYDYDNELAQRDTSKPYILTHDEFYNNEPEWPQISLTYYEADDVLTDDHDAPLQDYERLVGTDTLKFGYMSKDHNLVFIANERTKQMFEIARAEGSFAELVHGFRSKPEPKKRRPVRGDDE